MQVILINSKQKSTKTINMKKQFIGTITAMAMVFGTATLIGCGGEHSHEGHGEEVHEHHTEEAAESEDHADHEHAHYACPMDCEEGKVYEEAGTCPECKMDLVEVEEAAEAEVEATHEHAYACPMHPEITGHDGDKCSKCGMDLKENKD